MKKVVRIEKMQPAAVAVRGTSGPWPAVEKLIHKKKKKKKKKKETEKEKETEERQERAVSASSDDDGAGTEEEAPGCLVAAVRRCMHACLPSLCADARCVFRFIDLCVCVCVCVSVCAWVACTNYVLRQSGRRRKSENVCAS